MRNTLSSTPVRWSAPTPGMPARLGRVRFMTADAGAAGTAGAADATAGTGGAPQDANGGISQDAAAATSQQAGGDALPDDPAALKAMIADLRKENGAARTNAKAQAADDARAELAQTIGKALGIVQGDEAPTVDQLTQKLGATGEELRTALVELAVFRTAGQHGGNPTALTDSRAFLAKVANLDPAAADFQTQVTDAAKAAVAENQTLKAVQATGASSVDHAGGSGEAPRSSYKPGMSIADGLAADAAR